MRKTTNAAFARSAVVALIAAVLLSAGPAVAEAKADQPGSRAEAAPVLAPGAGYGQPHGSERVRALQRRLRQAGARPGPIDGLFGPLTEASVRRFQDEQGLAVDGVVGDATRGVLARRSAATTPERPRARASRSEGPRANPEPAANAKPKATKRPEPVPGGKAGRPIYEDRSGTAFPGLGLGLLLVGVVALALAAVSLGLGLRARQRRGAQAPPSAPSAPSPARSAASPASSPTPPAARSAPSPPSGAGRRNGPRGAAERRPPGRKDAGRTRMLGYASVSGSVNRMELTEQAKVITRVCERGGLELLGLVREREPSNGKGNGKDVERPGLGYALARISTGEAQGLVVSELSRLSRSAAELGGILEWLIRAEARLVAVAQGLDTDTREGRRAARMLIDVSNWERERLSERTRKGLQAARRQGRRTGRRAVADDPELRERIARMRAEGMTLQAIADRLNEMGVPTVRGGAKWRPSSVQAATGYKRRPRSPLESRPDTNGSPGKERSLME